MNWDRQTGSEQNWIFLTMQMDTLYFDCGSLCPSCTIVHSPLLLKPDRNCLWSWVVPGPGRSAWWRCPCPWPWPGRGPWGQGCPASHRPGHSRQFLRHFRMSGVVALSRHSRHFQKVQLGVLFSAESATYSTYRFKKWRGEKQVKPSFTNYQPQPKYSWAWSKMKGNAWRESELSRPKATERNLKG